eukprot:m.190870 g.190870  ORF g.190870 m.190870 type:complete len:1365 (+) comp21712_c0_seq1:1588-5682(+)
MEARTTNHAEWAKNAVAFARDNVDTAETAIRARVESGNFHQGYEALLMAQRLKSPLLFLFLQHPSRYLCSRGTEAAAKLCADLDPCMRALGAPSTASHVREQLLSGLRQRRDAERWLPALAPSLAPSELAEVVLAVRDPALFESLFTEEVCSLMWNRSNRIKSVTQRFPTVVARLLPKGSGMRWRSRILQFLAATRPDVALDVFRGLTPEQHVEHRGALLQCLIRQPQATLALLREAPSLERAVCVGYIGVLSEAMTRAATSRRVLPTEELKNQVRELAMILIQPAHVGSDLLSCLPPLKLSLDWWVQLHGQCNFPGFVGAAKSVLDEEQFVALLYKAYGTEANVPRSVISLLPESAHELCQRVAMHLHAADRKDTFLWPYLPFDTAAPLIQKEASHRDSGVRQSMYIMLVTCNTHNGGGNLQEVLGFFVKTLRNEQDDVRGQALSHLFQDTPAVAWNAAAHGDQLRTLMTYSLQAKGSSHYSSQAWNSVFSTLLRCTLNVALDTGSDETALAAFRQSLASGEIALGKSLISQAAKSLRVADTCTNSVQQELTVLGARRPKYFMRAFPKFLEAIVEEFHVQEAAAAMKNKSQTESQYFTVLTQLVKLHATLLRDPKDPLAPTVLHTVGFRVADKCELNINRFGSVQGNMLEFEPLMAVCRSALAPGSHCSQLLARDNAFHDVVRFLSTLLAHPTPLPWTASLIDQCWALLKASPARHVHYCNTRVQWFTVPGKLVLEYPALRALLAELLLSNADVALKGALLDRVFAGMEKTALVALLTGLMDLRKLEITEALLASTVVLTYVCYHHEQLLQQLLTAAQKNHTACAALPASASLLRLSEPIQQVWYNKAAPILQSLSYNTSRVACSLTAALPALPPTIVCSLLKQCEQVVGNATQANATASAEAFAQASDFGQAAQFADHLVQQMSQCNNWPSAVLECIVSCVGGPLGKKAINAVAPLLRYCNGEDLYLKFEHILTKTKPNIGTRTAVCRMAVANNVCHLDNLLALLWEKGQAHKDAMATVISTTCCCINALTALPSGTPRMAVQAQEELMAACAQPRVDDDTLSKLGYVLGFWTIPSAVWLQKHPAESADLARRLARFVRTAKILHQHALRLLSQLGCKLGTIPADLAVDITHALASRLLEEVQQANSSSNWRDPVTAMVQVCVQTAATAAHAELLRWADGVCTALVQSASGTAPFTEMLRNALERLCSCLQHAGHNGLPLTAALLAQAQLQLAAGHAQLGPLVRNLQLVQVAFAPQTTAELMTKLCDLAQATPPVLWIQLMQSVNGVKCHLGSLDQLLLSALGLKDGAPTVTTLSADDKRFLKMLLACALDRNRADLYAVQDALVADDDPVVAGFAAHRFYI